MFPKEKDHLVGKTFYDDQSKPLVIAGVIEQMHGAWVGWDKLDRVLLAPLVGPGPGIRYLVRTEPGKLDSVMAAVEVALRKRDPNRVVGKLRTLQNFKQSSYASDSLMAVTLSVVTGLVLIFSSLGIFGLATFNVNTRTRQIGTRRAVGARKRDIVSYFLAENWMVTTLGVVVGCGLALARRLLAVEPVRAAATRSLLPRGRRGRTLGPGAAGGVATGAAGGQGLAGHGDAQRLTCPTCRSVHRLQPFGPAPASYV